MTFGSARALKERKVSQKHHTLTNPKFLPHLKCLECTKPCREIPYPHVLDTMSVMLDTLVRSIRAEINLGKFDERPEHREVNPPETTQSSLGGSPSLSSPKNALEDGRVQHINPMLHGGTLPEDRTHQGELPETMANPGIKINIRGLVNINLTPQDFQAFIIAAGPRDAPLTRSTRTEKGHLSPNQHVEASP